MIRSDGWNFFTIGGQVFKIEEFSCRESIQTPMIDRRKSCSEYILRPTGLISTVEHSSAHINWTSYMTFDFRGPSGKLLHPSDVWTKIYDIVDPRDWPCTLITTCFPRCSCFCSVNVFRKMSRLSWIKVIVFFAIVAGKIYIYSTNAHRLSGNFEFPPMEIIALLQYATLRLRRSVVTKYSEELSLLDQKIEFLSHKRFRWCQRQFHDHSSLNLLAGTHIAHDENIRVELTNFISFATFCWLSKLDFSW